MSKEPIFIHQNLKLLRKRTGLTQLEVANACNMTRSKIAGYETHIQPTLVALIALADFYNVSTDILLKENLNAWSEFRLKDLDNGIDKSMSGKNLRILATTVNNDNENNTEMVPVKARAGYLLGYSDPDFMKNLPQINLPMLPKGKKHRAFQISGDSMLPVADKDWVVCSYFENWLHLKDGERYIILTKDDGIVFKMAYNKMKDNKGLLLISSNPLYKPYFLAPEEIKEVWKFEWWITDVINN
jgi:transcriptional regulator with XRE-family HTH domain